MHWMLVGFFWWVISSMGLVLTWSALCFLVQGTTHTRARVTSRLRT